MMEACLLRVAVLKGGALRIIEEKSLMAHREVGVASALISTCTTLQRISSKILFATDSLNLLPPAPKGEKSILIQGK
jgi:hypothetical protein